MAIFSLKARDTRPILEVALKNADGSPHDLTGSTGWKLHVYIAPSVVFTRDMVKEGLDTDGVLRYAWVPTDWDTPGGLPLPRNPYSTRSLYMEYEVSGGSSKMTFPNGTFDILRIRGDIG